MSCFSFVSSREPDKVGGVLADNVNRVSSVSSEYIVRRCRRRDIAVSCQNSRHATIKSRRYLHTGVADRRAEARGTRLASPKGNEEVPEVDT